MTVKSPNQARQDSSTLSKEEIEHLRNSVKGTVVTRKEASKADYEAAVNRWNAVSIRPANIVVYVEDEEDVVQCVKFVRQHHLDVAVAGGRHSYHGASSSVGMVIDLRRMRNVSVNKAAMTVTAQGGCLARDVEQPCEAQGLSAVFGAINETGIGGLTLGGGVGFLTGAYGLALDNLLSAQMVLASGEIVNVSDEENSDLFWAIRGAGPNFGVVTEFTYRVHRQGPVFSQTLFFSAEKLNACVALVNKMHNIALKSDDGKLQIVLGYLTPPGTEGLVPTYRIFYDGPEEKAKELAAPIYALEPTRTVGGVKSYHETTEEASYMKFSGFERYAASSAHMMYPLDEALLLSVLEKFKKVVDKYKGHTHPSKCIVDLRNYQKVASRSADATAYPGRVDCCWIIPELRWDDPSMDTKMRKEVTGITAYLREEMQRKKMAASAQEDGQSDATAIYPNISAGGEEKAKSVYGKNLPRLQILKKKYDPDSMWNKWFPIKPA